MPALHSNIRSSALCLFVQSLLLSLTSFVVEDGSQTGRRDAASSCISINKKYKVAFTIKGIRPGTALMIFMRIHRKYRGY